MASFLWILSMICGLVALGLFVSAGEWPLALGVLLTMSLLIGSASSAFQRGSEHDEAEKASSKGIVSQMIDEIVELPVRWHALGLTTGAMLFALFVWQYGGLSWPGIALVGVTIAFALMIVVGRRRHRGDDDNG